MRKYIIDDIVFTSEEAAAEYIYDENFVSEDDFDEMLDDTYGEVCIADYTYNTSYALKEIDPTAYRCEFANYADFILEEIREDCACKLESEDSYNDDIYINGFCITIIDDEEIEME